MKLATFYVVFLLVMTSSSYEGLQLLQLFVFRAN